MNRRKTKSERELMADISKTTLKFCEKQGRCPKCPLQEIKEKHDIPCAVAYVYYLIEKGVQDNENNM